MIDKDESGAISKAEIDSFGDMLGLQHVYPKNTRDALWNAVADEDGEIHLVDQEGIAQDRGWGIKLGPFSFSWW